MIETGIQIVNTEGVNAFSLRKVAAACGVSHAAPYSHFQNKEELLEAMQLFITDRFSKQLESTVQKNNNVAEILKDMGIAYVSFFVDNPAYFQFLYSQSNIKIDLSLSIPDDQNYKPYIIYKNVVSELLEQTHYSEGKQNDIIIKTSFLLIQSITVTYLKLYGILSAKILMYGKENVFSLLQQWDCLAAMVQAYLQDCSRDTAHRYGVDFI